METRRTIKLLLLLVEREKSRKSMLKSFSVDIASDITFATVTPQGGLTSNLALFESLMVSP